MRGVKCSQLLQAAMAIRHDSIG